MTWHITFDFEIQDADRVWESCDYETIIIRDGWWYYPTRIWTSYDSWNGDYDLEWEELEKHPSLIHAIHSVEEKLS